MAEVDPELVKQMTQLIEYARNVFDNIPLTEEEKVFARQAAQKVHEFSLRLLEDESNRIYNARTAALMRGEVNATMKVPRVIAICTAMASAMASMDAFGRAADKILPPKEI